MVDVPLGEQVLSLIATLAALVVGGLVVADVMASGLSVGAAHFAIGMTAFGVARWGIGRSIHPSGDTAPVLAASAADDNDDD